MRPSTIALGAGALLLLFMGGGSTKRSLGAAVAGVARRAASAWRGLVETMPEALPLIRSYWEGAGLPFPGVSEPWSGAFISWTVRQAAPSALVPSGAHVFYARQAYRDKGVPGRYGAYRPNEVRVEPGDILLRGRAEEAPSFEDLRSGSRFIPMHADIVVEVAPASLVAVGGNLDNAVKERVIPHQGGVVADPAVFAVLRLQA